MGTFKGFEEIEAWQKARELTKRIYEVSKEGAFAGDFGLRDQIRKASGLHHVQHRGRIRASRYAGI